MNADGICYHLARSTNSVYAVSCQNHPNAPSIDTCNRCGIEMCGMCANFLEKGVYCEKCTKHLDSENFVKTQSDQFRQREAPTPEIHQADPAAIDPQRPANRDRGIIWLGVGSAAVMLFFSLALYAFPTLFEFDAEASAARIAEQSLEDCRLVFEEIGYLLEQGELPDASMRCVESNMPNIVTRQGDSVRISHPNPGAHLLSAIYVSSSTHEVVFEP